MQIKLQVALVTPLIHVKGYAAPETKAAVERARRLIEQAEALGEPPEDPLLLFSILFGFWVANPVRFQRRRVTQACDAVPGPRREAGATVPLMIAHRLMGPSLLFTGDFTESRAHLDRAFALYDPTEHRPLATRFGQDVRVAVLFYRSLALWPLGYPVAAVAYSDQALSDAREIGQAATLMPALALTSLTHIHCGNYAVANAQLNEVIALADEKGALFWKVGEMVLQGCVSALTGKASDAVHMIVSGMNAWRSTGATVWMPVQLSYLARAYVELGQFDNARRCIGEAMRAVETTKEGWYEADIHRIAGEIELLAEPDAAKAEEYFERALAVARAQQTKSFELRAAMEPRPPLARPG